MNQERMRYLEKKIFRELVRENVIVRAAVDAGNYHCLPQYDMLLEMVVALAESNKQLTGQVIHFNMVNPKPMVIHCTPEQAAEFFKLNQVGNSDE